MRCEVRVCELPRRRGQHGPRRSLELALRGAARRLELDEDRAVAELRNGWLDRAQRRRQRTEVVRRRDVHAYRIYSDYLLHGLPSERVHLYPHVDIPDGLLQRSAVARRTLHSPGTLARWAYRIRVLHEPAAAVWRRELEESDQLREYAERALREVVCGLRHAIACHDPIEVAYQQARHAFFADRALLSQVYRLLERANPEAAIRQAVKRHHHVWELAEQRFRSQ